MKYNRFLGAFFLLALGAVSADGLTKPSVITELVIKEDDGCTSLISHGREVAFTCHGWSLFSCKKSYLLVARGVKYDQILTLDKNFNGKADIAEKAIVESVHSINDVSGLSYKANSCNASDPTVTLSYQTGSNGPVVEIEKTIPIE